MEHPRGIARKVKGVAVAHPAPRTRGDLYHHPPLQGCRRPQEDEEGMPEAGTHPPLPSQPRLHLNGGVARRAEEEGKQEHEGRTAQRRAPQTFDAPGGGSSGPRSTPWLRPQISFPLSSPWAQIPTPRRRPRTARSPYGRIRSRETRGPRIRKPCGWVHRRRGMAPGELPPAGCARSGVRSGYSGTRRAALSSTSGAPFSGIIGPSSTPLTAWCTSPPPGPARAGGGEGAPAP